MEFDLLEKILFEMGGAPLRLWIDPGDASAEVVADVLRALSDLHAAAGGSGLRFEVDGNEIVALATEHA